MKKVAFSIIFIFSFQFMKPNQQIYATILSNTNVTSNYIDLPLSCNTYSQKNAFHQIDTDVPFSKQTVPYFKPLLENSLSSPILETSTISEYKAILELGYSIKESEKKYNDIYLKPLCTQEKIKQIYTDISNTLNHLKNEKDPWDIPLPAFGDLAAHLYKAFEQDCSFVFQHKMNEFLNNSKNQNITSYAWFLKFMSLCAVSTSWYPQNSSKISNLASSPEGLYQKYVSLSFDPLKYVLEIESHEANPYAMIGSLNYLIKRFPDIIILPNPFNWVTPLEKRIDTIHPILFPKTKIFIENSLKQPDQIFYEQLLKIATLDVLNEPAQETLSSLTDDEPYADDTINQIEIYNNKHIFKLSTLIQEAEKTDESGFLKTSVPKDEIFRIYNNISDSFQYLTDHEKPWDIPLSEFYDLARLFLNRISNDTKSVDLMDNKYFALQKAEKFLEESFKNNLITYRWFLKFSGLCAAIMTIGYKDSAYIKDTDNVYSYQQFLMNSYVDSNYDPQTYFDCVDKTGSPVTHELGSLNAMAALFPEIVIIPFPFDLTDVDIFLNFPGKNKHVWFAGFAHKPVTADEFNMNPHLFFYHDILHLASIRQALQSTNKCLPKTIYPEYLNDFSCKIIEDAQKDRVSLLFDVLELSQQFLVDFMLNPANDIDIKQMYGFFSFLIFHENNVSITSKFHSIFNPSFLLSTKIRNKEIYSSLDYYGSLLPAKILEDIKSNNWSTYDLLVDNFYKEFHLYLQTHNPVLWEKRQSFFEKEYLFFSVGQSKGVEGCFYYNPSIYYTDYYEHVIRPLLSKNTAFDNRFEMFYKEFSIREKDFKNLPSIAIFYNFSGNPFKAAFDPKIKSMDIFTNQSKEEILQNKEKIAQMYKDTLPSREDEYPLPNIRYFGSDRLPVQIH
ncbi:MAG: hypothetical protein Q8L85_09615 [Alphaproteobacteria bacterium]|nr:hypothetical protein [Alphaproteobacteria bacterium]